MKIITKVIGAIQTNCYFIVNEETSEVIIIDPADDADYIIGCCEKLQARAIAILLTHGHYDHTGGAAALKEKFNIPIYAGEKEKVVLSDSSINGTLLFASETVRRGAKPIEADFWLADGEIIELAGFSLKAVSTPGHTAGGICYYMESENLLFSGDVLFADSYGRTDLPTGSQEAIRDSILNKLFILPEETKVYPGHGSGTNIKYEKENNPIL